MNILEALKKYIRANGGSSRANNISEAVKDLNSIPQGSGGGAVVEFEINEDFSSVNANYTPMQVWELAKTQYVIGIASCPDGMQQPIGSFIATDSKVGFGLNSTTSTPLIGFNLSDMQWELDFPD